MSQTTATPAGLQDVVAAPSRICYIDGDQGILAYGGYSIHELAEKSSFEEVIFLLWHGRLPKQSELNELNAGLAANRAIPAEIVALTGMLVFASRCAASANIAALVDAETTLIAR